MLGTTNRGNPFRWPVERDGKWMEVDRSDEVLQAFAEYHLDGLIVIGGDGSLAIARDLCAKGAPIVGVPKTIDNDVGATHVTFGFHTAVETATEAIGKLHSTAESHSRVFVVEVMGRHAGWIALYAGLAGTADVILIPEIPFDLRNVCEKIANNDLHGKHYAIVVVAEGARAKDSEVICQDNACEIGRQEVMLGGIGEWVAGQIRERTGKDVRSLVLGHLQRGGSPTTFDRLLALRFGAAAVRLAEAGKFGHMVALVNGEMQDVTLDEATRQRKMVQMDDDKVHTAREIGICLGD